MRLRYTGPQPVSFPALRLFVEPDTDFEVDDEEAQRLLRHPDVEEAPAAAPRRKAAKPAAPAQDPAGEPAPVTEEVNRGVPDDH